MIRLQSQDHECLRQILAVDTFHFYISKQQIPNPNGGAGGRSHELINQECLFQNANEVKG